VTSLPPGPPPEVQRDDRVLAVTRAVSVAIVPILTAAFVILFFFPGQTRALWGWTIKSRMSAMFIGGGYLAGALFFARAARATEWHRLGPGFVATTVFATLLGVATFAEWDQFNHGHISFWAWVALYVATPLLLPWLYLNNRSHDPRTLQPGDVTVPRGIRTALGALGGAQLAFAVALFVRPSLFQARWPWPLTPLTARTVAGFALRWPFETAIVGVAFIALAAVRSSGDFRPGAVAWAWRAGLVVAEVFLVGVWLAMRRREERARAPLPSSA